MELDLIELSVIIWVEFFLERKGWKLDWNSRIHLAVVNGKWKVSAEGSVRPSAAKDTDHNNSRETLAYSFFRHLMSSRPNVQLVTEVQ